MHSALDTVAVQYSSSLLRVQKLSVKGPAFGDLTVLVQVRVPQSANTRPVRTPRPAPPPRSPPRAGEHHFLPGCLPADHTLQCSLRDETGWT